MSSNGALIATIIESIHFAAGQPGFFSSSFLPPFPALHTSQES